jgi:ABC-type glycerol-3-phosphate transport system permease component
MVNEYAGLIVPAIGGVMGVFLLRQFMRTLPSELEDAASIDGCSEFGVFWRIILPLSLPGLGMLAIMTSTGVWNALIWPIVIINDKAKYTLPVGLALLRSEWVVNYGITSAAAFLSVVPMMFIFAFFQRYFVAGLTVGALKG